MSTAKSREKAWEHARQPKHDGVCLDIGIPISWTQFRLPTPQTSSINTFLLIAASLQREVTLGDVKTAFMQGEHKERPKGKLYASLPPGGIPLGDGS